MSEAGKAPTFHFYKGAEDALVTKSQGEFDWETAATKVREQLAEALNAHNLCFLLGSGSSSYLKEGKQIGVPTMAPLAQEFLSGVSKPDEQAVFLTDEEKVALKEHFGIDDQFPEYAGNLERLMEVLLSLDFALEKNPAGPFREKLGYIKSAIQKVTNFIRTKCTSGEFSNGDDTVLKLYQSFYRKLVYRERTRSRPWVFTTNYDLFNETALDRLGVPYGNGFTGSVERRFNPASYRYSLAEQLDISNQRWSAVDGYLYLCKLHGSINWIDDGNGFFRVREMQTADISDSSRVMIYPTPAKQNSSFGSPYVDLFREFQMRVVREQTVLFVIGYSFGDEHINNIIFQALTIPSFRLVVFAAPSDEGVIGKLKQLGDPRVWLIGGDGPDPKRQAHYFDVIVEKFLPQLPGDKVDRAVEKVIDTLMAKAVDNDAAGGHENG